MTRARGRNTWDKKETKTTQELIANIDRVYPNTLTPNSLLDTITTIVDKYLAVQLVNGEYKIGERGYYSAKCGRAIGVVTIYALKYLKQKETITRLKKEIDILQKEKELRDLLAESKERN